MTLRRTLAVSFTLALLAAGLWSLNPVPAAAQEGRDIWSDPQNLQVLPKDIDPQMLRGLMVGAAQGLGVRCWACHVGEEGQPLPEFDFQSDEKKMKKIAREMFKMTLRINQETMPAVAALEGEEEAGRVRCVTCHRGEVKPKLDEE